MALKLAAIQKPENQQVDNRMGEITSKLFWRRRASLGNQPTVSTLGTLSDDFVMAPGSDELSPGHDGPSIDPPQQNYDQDIVWPYSSTSSQMSNAFEDEPDLNKRRPALYEEYWTWDSRRHRV